MDTTETYIKICEKSPLRELWRPSIGDFYCDKRKDYLRVGVITEPFDYGENPSKTVFPLYRQDQLQEMIADKYPKLNEMVYFFWSWMERECAIEILGLTSMEQLWMAFVMRENHNKVWNGEYWTKEE